MNNRVCFTFLLWMLVPPLWAQATMVLEDITLMHEMRATPSPLNEAVVADKDVSFMWPLPGDAEISNSGLDGFEHVEKNKKPDGDKVNYRIRIAKDAACEHPEIVAETSWPFYNPDYSLPRGRWYWQYGYVEGEHTKWSEVLTFTVKNSSQKFSPPSYKEFVGKLPLSHPRILIFESEWDDFMKRSVGMEQREWYLERADKNVNVELVSLVNVIDTSKLAELDNAVKRSSLLTRESRRIIDREEATLEALIRAFILTKERRYYEAAMTRIKEIISWKMTPYFVGDFNQATLLSLCSMAYDSFYGLLTEEEKVFLLDEIKENGSKIFRGFVNHLENHIADNHNWQMNLRIFTMAAFAVYGDLPEAARWTDYCYNLWLARFPGLNKDGAWHNGDSYFHTNIRTLVEVPYFYTRVSGFDFFSDPWYRGSAMYVIYQQPPFSKSAGNGSSHQMVTRPIGARIGYADALARMTNNTYLADYVRIILNAGSDMMKRGFLGKSGDLSWFRLQCDKPLPEGRGLGSLPLSYIFPETGVASFMSDWKDVKRMKMVTFRSSPYGSTSHALANQNAFNTFYAGKPLFYSSGHHIEFTDEHSVYCHRSTRAHNSILVNGMGQRIGTEGYGWIPRHYTGDKIGYLVGDASNAYGEVVSPLWQMRGKQSGLEYTPENGWDKNRLKTFRRHLVQLGDAGLMFIYDELEADTAVSWNYLLHTIENPMVVSEQKNFVQIRATSTYGVSDAYLFAADKLGVEQTDQFFYPAINWLRADDKGYFAPYKDHWHFTATTPERTVYRFATVISTHHKDEPGVKPRRTSKDTIQVGDWFIKLNLSPEGNASFTVENKQENIKLVYDDSTVITERGRTVELTDQFPELEI